MTQSTGKLPRILCVDDEPSILSTISRLLRQKNIEVLTATSGELGLELLKQHQVQVIISDMRMPGMSGVDFLQQAMLLQEHAYRILLTGFADMPSTIAAINDAHIHRYLGKPWVTADLLSAIKEGLYSYHMHLEHRRMQRELQERVSELKQLNHDLEAMVEIRTKKLRRSLAQHKHTIAQLEAEKQSGISILYNIISIHPAISARFASNVAFLCKALARELGLDKEQRNTAFLSGLLHELGLIGLPNDLIEKPLYALNVQERQQFYTHVEKCELILSPAIHLRPIVDSISHQYAKFSGSEEGESPSELPIQSRILAVARDYWLLITSRSTERTLTPKEAFQILIRGQGSIYDPTVVDAMARCYQSSRDIFNETTKDGYTVDQLKPGMVLRSAVYNDSKMMLLRKGTELSDLLIERLQKYQSKQNSKLIVDIYQQAPRLNVEELE